MAQRIPRPTPMYGSEHGFVPNGLVPNRPTQWSIITQTGTIRVGVTEKRIYDLDVRGWDKLGIRVTATGLDTGDTVTIEVNSPEGATYRTISLVAAGTGSDQAAHGVTTDIIDIQSPKYVLTAVLTSSSGTTVTNLTIVAFLKGSSFG